jgi:hypothetical protein
MFAECGATQQCSVGWVPPRGKQYGPLASKTVASLFAGAFTHCLPGRQLELGLPWLNAASVRSILL